MQVLRIPAVKEKTGLSTATIYRLVEKGLFPKPISIGNPAVKKNAAVGWLDDEIDAYIEAARAKRDGGAA